jgi:2-polyprenyl-6-methoxyphenol hydroxylase-like FAD-dependent oxidoreductase
VDRGEEIAISAAWVVGADGANSKVRGWAGIEWHDEGYFYDWLVVDVKPRPGVEFPHIAAQSLAGSRLSDAPGTSWV